MLPNVLSVRVITCRQCSVGKAELADITTSSSAADAAAADDDDEARTVVSAGVSWSGIYYVTADGRLCLCGVLNDITDRQSLSPVKPALCLQVSSVSQVYM